MAAKSKPYIITWERAKELEAANARLSTQLSRINEMFDTLFKAVEDLTARVEALE